MADKHLQRNRNFSTTEHITLHHIASHPITSRHIPLRPIPSYHIAAHRTISHHNDNHIVCFSFLKLAIEFQYSSRITSSIQTILLHVISVLWNQRTSLRITVWVLICSISASRVFTEKFLYQPCCMFVKTFPVRFAAV
jgi:hypothetical protein